MENDASEPTKEKCKKVLDSVIKILQKIKILKIGIMLTIEIEICQLQIEKG